MAQTFEQLIDGNTQFRNLYNYVQGSLNTLKSQFSGTSAPNSPVAGQQWFNTTDKNTYQYKVDNVTGIGSWDNTSPTELQAEIELARGTNASLNARLSIGINADGTFKEAVPVTANTWVDEENTITYLTTATFKINGDVRAVYVADRAIKLTQTNNRTSYVSSTTLDSGNTIITVKGGAVDTGLTAVAYSTMVKENQPYINVDTSDKANLDLSNLSATGLSKLLPTGVILPAPLTSLSGFILCNGQAVSRTTYSALFTAIGISFGVGDNSTTFNVPDYRGKFLRGLGGNSAGDFITTQTDAIREITGVGPYYQVGHGGASTSGAITYQAGSNMSVGAGAGACSQGRILFNASGSVPTAVENRPINQAINYFIKT